MAVTQLEEPAGDGDDDVWTPYHCLIWAEEDTSQALVEGLINKYNFKNRSIGQMVY